MKLSERDRKIFACAEMAGDAPLSNIAKRAGHKSHTVRHCLKRLIDQGLVYRAPILNLTSLGFDEYLVYYSVASERSKIRSSLLAALQQSQQVKWLFELGGDFQFVMGVMARSPSELSRFMDDLSNRFGNIFFQKAVATVVCAAHYGRRYLSLNGPPHGRGVFIQEVPNTQSFDEIDHQIIRELSKHQDDSLRGVARAIGLPISTVRYRIKKMQACNLIAGYSYALSGVLDGIQAYRILVYAQGFDAELHKRLFAFCEKQPNIITCIKTLGNWDYEIRAEVEGSQDLAPLLRRLYDHFGSAINQLKSEPVLGVLKPTCYPVQDFTLVDIRRTPRP